MSTVRFPQSGAVQLEQETTWLSRKSMAKVFWTTLENVLMHLHNGFSSGKLDSTATTKDSLLVQTEGKDAFGTALGITTRMPSFLSVTGSTPGKACVLVNEQPEPCGTVYLADDAGEAILELVTNYADTWRFRLNISEGPGCDVLKFTEA